MIARASNPTGWAPGVLAAGAFFLSGTAALTYEILWQREMILVFGASAPATTAILTALFLGIAIGSRLEVKLQPWVRSSVLLLGLIELFIAAWAFCVPFVLSLSEASYVVIAEMIGRESIWLFPVRFLLAILTVLPATLGMGASVPVIVRIASGPRRLYPVAWAYGINIAGAVLGCLLAGFIFIRYFGLGYTRIAGITLSACVVLLAIVLHRISKGNYGQRSDLRPSRFPIPREHKVMGVLYFGAGFLALGLEIVWLRYLGILNSSSATTFTLALSIYLTGMGAGTLILYPLLARTGLKGRTLFSISNLGTAAAALCTYPLLFHAPGITHRILNPKAETSDLRMIDIIGVEVLLSGGLMLLPTLFMGLAFPAVCDTISPDYPGRKRLIGYWYFLGTAGSAAGIAVVALFLIPVLGLHGALAGLILLGAFLFVAVQWQGKGVWNLKWQCAVAAAVAVAAVSIAHNPRPVLRETTARTEEGEWREYSIETGEEVGRILRYEAGASATVVVKEVEQLDYDGVHRSNRRLYVDDQMVASTDLAAKTDAVMLAHLPLLLHPGPRRALTVGFGSGGTSHSMATHGVETVAVEIEPEVARSAYLFESQNHKVLDHPRFRLILNDARDYLRAATTAYDVISTDVTNLQYKQNSNLYTVEYFEMIRKNLDSGGIACAWIPMTAIYEEEFRTLLAGFQEVFPHATLWFINNTMTNFGILIGTPEPLLVDYQEIYGRMQEPQIGEDLARIGVVDPAQLIGFLLMDAEGIRSYVRGAPLHTDDHPVLEFSSLVSLYQTVETFRDNLSAALERSPQDRLAFMVNVPPHRIPEIRTQEMVSRAFNEALVHYFGAHAALRRGDGEGFIQSLSQSASWASVGTRGVRNEPYRRFFFEELVIAWFEEEARRRRTRY